MNPEWVQSESHGFSGEMTRKKLETVFAAANRIREKSREEFGRFLAFIYYLKFFL